MIWNIWYGKSEEDHGQLHDFSGYWCGFFKFRAKRKAKKLADEHEAVWLGQDFINSGSAIRIKGKATKFNEHWRGNDNRINKQNMR